MKEIALYTAIFGKVNRFRIPWISDSSIDRFCYTNADIMTKFYQMRYMNLGAIRRNVMKQRYVKICIPDEIFDNYEYSVYVDCKRPFSIDFRQLLDALESDSDFLTRPHRRRSCIYDEGEFCIRKKKDSKETIREQLEAYREDGYPKHNGLHATGLLLRRHTDRIRDFEKIWWQQISQYSHRDQISLPYVAWKFGLKISLSNGRPK